MVGGASTIAGGGAACATGAGCLAGAPAIVAGGLAAGQGLTMAGNGMKNLMNAQVDQSAAASGATEPEKQGHGNSLDTDKVTIQYSLQDRKTGEVLKYGETTKPNGQGRYS